MASTTAWLAVRDDLLEAANGTNTADSLASLGQDIESLTESMVVALNYQDEDGHYVFGGTINDQPPIVAVDDDGDGVTDSYSYQGNSDHRQTTVSNGVEVDTNVAASDFFGSNLDVLNTLNTLSQELQDPNVDRPIRRCRAIFRTPLMWWTPPRITSTPRLRRSARRRTPCRC